MLRSASVVAILFPLGLAAAADPPGVAIVPRPAVVEPRAGRFVLRADSVIVVERALENEARLLAATLAPATGYALEVALARSPRQLRRRRGLCRKKPRDPSACRSWIWLTTVRSRRIDPEAYRLDVLPGGVVVRARDGAGAFYGTQSFRQLLPPAIFSPAFVPATEWSAPGLRVVDRPRFGWRGAMLDSARHFMPKEAVKKLIDLLAVHKLNRFHWHLSDDQGWRIQIQKYPRLTEIGSSRAQSPVRMLPHGAFLNFFVNGFLTGRPTTFDGAAHAGFYTQEDVREIVAYAAERHVAVVPEIDMPGHISSAIAAYPELGNTGQPIPVQIDFGIHPDILNVREETFAFFQDVLDEVMGLFPGDFLHLGGDEVRMTQWEQSADAQTRMAELGFTDEHQLATYFTNRMGAFVTGHGRRYIGWNEILRDGLAPDAAVMSWTSQAPGIDAARAGRDVVMAPLLETYFDHPNALPLPPVEHALLGSFVNPAGLGVFVTGVEEAYGFEPVPDELSKEEGARVLGAQGQLWSEWILDARDVERAGFPRLAALSEAVWTPVARRDFADFSSRLATHLGRLEKLDVCYFGSPAAACL